MSAYEDLKHRLRGDAQRWLVTGAAGFIGSNLVETLLRLEQQVTGLDSFATGHRDNLEQVRAAVSDAQWRRFEFVEGDIRDLDMCRWACRGARYVLHQAALGSVVRSIEDPLATHQANVTGFLHMLIAARDAGVARFVYAGSSATYGDHPALPKIEPQIGRALSPYGLSKHLNELYADIFERCYGLGSIGLRYFNVFGPRQDPDSAYAAVIPAWIAAMIRNTPVYVNGDGSTTRDFCYVGNVVQANLLAATTANPDAVNQVYNIAANEQTSLNELFEMLRTLLARRYPHVLQIAPTYRDFRQGDVRFSRADIGKARRLLGFRAAVRVPQGMERTVDWYAARLMAEPAPEPETAPMVPTAHAPTPTHHTA
jgi:UDP-N-acetylglucosamine/UDP-N-acetyl-alpha-D-glucosaminouronate 4-epimerase